MFRGSLARLCFDTTAEQSSESSSSEEEKSLLSCWVPVETAPLGPASSMLLGRTGIGSFCKEAKRLGVVTLTREVLRSYNQNTQIVLGQHSRKWGLSTYTNTASNLPCIIRSKETFYLYVIQDRHFKPYVHVRTRITGLTRLEQTITACSLPSEHEKFIQESLWP